jgi:hypothetical protein
MGSGIPEKFGALSLQSSPSIERLARAVTHWMRKNVTTARVRSAEERQQPDHSQPLKALWS